MAIEGVQPAIPENPLAVDQSAADAEAKLGGGGGAAVKHTLNSSQNTVSTGHCLIWFVVRCQAPEPAAGAQPATVVPLVKQVLTKELQLYYDCVTDAIVNGTEKQQVCLYLHFQTASRLLLCFLFCRTPPGLSHASYVRGVSLHRARRRRACARTPVCIC